MDILERRPGTAAVHLLLASIASRNGDAGELRRQIDAARDCDTPALVLARLEYRWTVLAGARDAELRALDRLVELEPEEVKWRRNAFRARTRRVVDVANVSGDLDTAWERLVEACRANPDLAFAREVNYAVSSWIERDAGELGRLERLFEANPRFAGLFWCLAVAYDSHGQVARSRQLVQDNWHWAGLLEPPGDLQVWDFVDLSLMAPERLNPGVRYQSLLFSNRLEEAIELAPDWHRRILRDALDLSRRGRATLAPVRSPGPVTISGEDRSAGTVLVFPGLLEQAWMPVHVLDVFFAELGLRAIYLRDVERLLFLGGVPGLGDTVPAIVDALRKLIPGGPVYTMGFSGGGLPALVYAGPLGAVRSLVFSMPTTLDPVVVDRMGDQRARSWLRRFVSRVDPAPYDGPTLLARMPAGYRLTAYAPAGGIEDRRHAERLQGDPRACIRLVDGTDSHDSMGHAADQAGFLEICREALLGVGQDGNATATNAE